MAFEKDKYGYTDGCMKSKAAAMYALGATRIQVHEALGDPCLNVLRELEDQGYKILRKKVRIGKNKPHIRYTILDKE